MKITTGISAEQLDKEYREAVSAIGEQQAKMRLTRVAKRTIEKGEFADVERLLIADCMSERILGWRRGYLEALLSLAHRRWAKAEQVAERLIANVGRKPALLLLRAEAVLGLHRYEDAHESVVGVLNEFPGWQANAVVLLAKVLVAMGQPSQALNHLQQVSRDHPADPKVLTALGECARQAGKQKMAAEAFLKAIELSPGWRTPFQGLRFSIAAHKQLLPRAIEVLEAARASHPAARHVLGVLSLLYEQQGEIEKSTAVNSEYCRSMLVSKDPRLEDAIWPDKKNNQVGFIIVGPPKTGTTSLFGYLAKHPRMLAPHTKEINFFSLRYANGIDWYLSNFPSICDTTDFISGEASPGYFAGRDVDRRIQGDLRDPKIIIMLRNPVDRTVSAYFQRQKMHGVHASLEEVINTQLRRKLTGDLDLEYGSEVLAVSTYPPKLRRWFGTLGRNNCLVLNADKFFMDPRAAMEKVYEFLGLECVHGEYPAANVGVYRKDVGGLHERLASHFRPEIAEVEEILNEEMDWL